MRSTADARNYSLKSILGPSATLPTQAEEAVCFRSVDESVQTMPVVVNGVVLVKHGDTCISKSNTCSKSKVAHVIGMFQLQLSQQHPQTMPLQ